MDLDKIWEIIIAVSLAVTGCFARILNKNDEKQWRRLCAELFISGFAGYMILLITRLLGLSGDWVGLICGMAGWMGPKALDLIGDVIFKQISRRIKP